MSNEDPESISEDLPVSDRVAHTVFVHPSERAAAQILDFYRINWEYEPTSFPLEWDADGRALAYFTPDFYLPDYDLYIELTTMNQKLVTKKNRKVRRLKELYPEVSIKVFYQKDFRKLLFRFGVPVRSREHAQGGGFEAHHEERDFDTTHEDGGSAE